MNVAMTGSGLLVEVQCTAEGRPFSKNRMTRMVALAEKGIKELLKKQRDALAE